MSDSAFQVVCAWCGGRTAVVCDMRGMTVVKCVVCQSYRNIIKYEAREPKKDKT